jgi:hypothetical protein
MLQIQIIYTHLINVSISLILPSPLAQGPVHIMDFDLRTIKATMQLQIQFENLSFSKRQIYGVTISYTSGWHFFLFQISYVLSRAESSVFVPQFI